jgi:poly(3-hydroxybutyrate) depolymerase
MKATLSVLAALSAAAAALDSKSNSDDGCQKPLPSGVKLDQSVDLTLNSTSGVSPRRYRLHIPSSYDSNTQVPLILSFHGRGKDAEYQEALSQFSNASYGFDGIVAYPEGVPVCESSLQNLADEVEIVEMTS